MINLQILETETNIGKICPKALKLLNQDIFQLALLYRSAQSTDQGASVTKMINILFSVQDLFSEANITHLQMMIK